MESGATNNYTVLLVEDNPDALDLAKLQLEGGGFTVSTATHAGGVLDLLEEKCGAGDCFNAIVLDIDLPDVRGTTLGGWIRKIYHNLPIVYYTAYGRLPAFVKAAEEQKATLLTKPVNREELVNTVRESIINSKNIVSVPEEEKSFILTVSRAVLSKDVKTFRDARNYAL